MHPFQLPESWPSEQCKEVGGHLEDDLLRMLKEQLPLPQLPPLPGAPLLPRAQSCAAPALSNLFLCFHQSLRNPVLALVNQESQ